MQTQEKTFKDCTLKFLEKNFALEEVKKLPALSHWLDRTVEITDFDRHQLQALREVLDFNVHDWNEYELAIQFIGPLLTIINFSSKKYNLFSQRDLEGIVDTYRLYGKPDGMIATGRREPEKPFFAFQEYKRQLDPDGDPAGQALAAMLVGQRMDEVTKPIYGCYIVGHDWRFMALEGSQYAISQDYSAITDDIFEIFRILKALKAMILELTASE